MKYRSIISKTPCRPWTPKTHQWLWTISSGVFHLSRHTWPYSQISTVKKKKTRTTTSWRQAITTSTV